MMTHLIKEQKTETMKNNGAPNHHYTYQYYIGMNETLT
jgi:hypothetical protein